MKKVFLRYDNTNLSNPVVHQRLVDLDHYYNHFVCGWDFLDTTNLHVTLNKLADEKVEWVVVSALGNYLRRGSIDDQIITNCQEATAPLAGHLLDRFGYYNIDPQFFCLDLTVWNKVGRPRFEEDDNREKFTSVTVDRSVENFHDDYTPHWLSPGTQSQEYSVDRTWFGARVIRRFLENGYTLINVNEEIRNRKIHLYPNHNEAELVPMFSDLTYEPTAPILKQYSSEMKQQFYFEDKHVYVLNTERVISKIAEPIDVYFGVCGGLKAVAILHKNGFNKHTQINLFDISPPALEYQEFLVNNWDGDFDNYESIFNQFESAHPDLPYAWRSWNTWEHEIELFLTSGEITKEEFKNTWQKYIKLPITYTCINLLNHESVNTYFNQFKITESKTYYVWVSNAYRMEHTMFLYGEEWYADKIKNLNSKLMEFVGNVYLESCITLYQLK